MNSNKRLFRAGINVFTLLGVLLLLYLITDLSVTGFSTFDTLATNSCPVWQEPQDEGNMSFIEDISYAVELNATDSDSNVTFSLFSINKTSNQVCFGSTSSQEAQASDFTVTTSDNDAGLGDLTFNLGRTLLGNYTLDLEVSDEPWVDSGACDRHVVIHFSFNCSYDPPVLSSISNQTILFNTSFYHDAIVSGDAENFTFADNTTLFNINSSSGEINFTANETGEFLVNISVNDYNDSYDSNNYLDYQIVKFTIAKKPVINWTTAQNVSGVFSVTQNGTKINITNSSLILNDTMVLTIRENSTVIFNHSSYELEENPGNNTNLTYSWKLNGNKESTDSAWSYSPGFTDLGKYNLTLEVQNTFGLVSSKVWNLTVTNTYRKPIFLPRLRPKLEIFYNTTSGNTTNINSIIVQPNSTEAKDTYINDSSNQTYDTEKFLIVNNNYRSLLEFNINSVPSGLNITKAEVGLYLINFTNSNSINVSIYQIINGWNANETNWDNRAANQSWDTPGGDFNSTEEDMVSVNDKFKWYGWNITQLFERWYNNTVNNTGLLLNNGNVGKKFASSDYKGNIPDQTWNEDHIIHSDTPAPDANYYNAFGSLEQYFKEIDGENLSYSYSGGGVNIDISIDEDGCVEFNPQADWHGTETVVFYASNPGGLSARSNNITLTVEEEEEKENPRRSRTTPRTRTEEETETASLDIILEPSTTLEPEDKTTLPVILRNSGEKGLSNINLSLNTSFGPRENITAKLTLSHFGSLATGENTTTHLKIITRNATEKNYTITVIAEVDEPSLTQTAMIRTEVKETQKRVKADIAEKIQFVQDLFEENPECVELQPALQNAKQEMDKGNYQKANRILTTAIEDCKALILYKKREEGKFNIKFIQEALSQVVISLIALLVLIFIIYKVSKYKIKGK